MDVYLLWHLRPLEGQAELDPEMDYIETDDKLCGAFRSEAAAEEARVRLRLMPGFKDHPDAFQLDCYTLGDVAWDEGFVSE